MQLLIVRLLDSNVEGNTRAEDVYHEDVVVLTTEPKEDWGTTTRFMVGVAEGVQFCVLIERPRQHVRPSYDLEGLGILVVCDESGHTSNGVLRWDGLFQLVSSY